MKKFLGFLFTAILTAGLTFVLVSGNFFMWNLVIKNKTKAGQEINEAIAGYAYAKYYDLRLVEETIDGENSLKNETSVQFSYNENFHFDFAGHRKSTEVTAGVEEVTEIDFYFVNGWLYIKQGDDKTKVEKSFGSALGDIFIADDMILLEAIDYSEEFFGDESEFSTKFIFSFSPFYIGLGYGIHGEEIATEYDVIFKLDMQKHFRGLDYSISFGTAQFNVNTDVLSYNKSLTLALPSDLALYMAV